MKKTFRTGLILLILSWFTNTICFAATVSNVSLAPMLQKVLPAVVNIRAQIKITDLNTLNRIQKSQQQEN